MLARGSLASLILWGPPGCGKTTIARLLAARAGLDFVQLSAVFSGVADLKRAFVEAARRRRDGKGTLLFVDEIHRFNRAQQDGFLPVCRGRHDHPDRRDDREPVVRAERRAAVALPGSGAAPARRCGAAKSCWREPRRSWPRAAGRRGGAAALFAMADGDGRYLINMAEQLAALPAEKRADGPRPRWRQLLPQRAPLYDKDREEHYNLISALHKSLRGSDVDAALYWFARMLERWRGPAIHRPPPGAFRGRGYRHGRSACADPDPGGLGHL